MMPTPAEPRANALPHRASPRRNDSAGRTVLTKRLKCVTIRKQWYRRCISLAAKSTELCYKGHPLRRKDNLLYYGSMADKYIIMMQILDTKKVKDL